MVIEKRMLNWHKLWKYWIPVIAYMALIFYLSSRPMPEEILPEIWNVDKVAHFIEYGVLGFLWSRALKSKQEMPKAALIAFVITFLYAVSDEIHQYFVPNRNASVYDVIADGLGGWLGIWVYRRWF